MYLIFCFTGLILFGFGQAIVYLYIFNRRTRQSLHDLILGTFVTQTTPRRTYRLRELIAAAFPRSPSTRCSGRPYSSARIREGRRPRESASALRNVVPRGVAKPLIWGRAGSHTEMDRDGFAIFANCFNWGGPDADPYEAGPGTLGSPVEAPGAKAFDHLRGTGMSQAQPGASSGNLFRLAAVYLLLSVSNSASAQSPDEPPMYTAGAATPASSDPAPPEVTAPSRLGPGSEAITGSGMPAYKLLRYDEDYSYLEDPTRRTDFWDTPWEYDVEAIWQFGRFGRGSIEAGGIASAIRYNFDELPLRPRVGLVADITSGDRNPRSPNLQTFNPMLPTGAYLNLANPIGPANFIQLHPNTDVRFGDKVTLLADWAFVWQESVEDGIYGPFVGPPIRTGQLSRNPFVGNSPSVTLTWIATRHITVLANYVHFFTGPFLRETPPGKDMDYVAFWIDYTF